MVRYVGVIQRGVLSIIFVYRALSGASNRIGFRECAALIFLGGGTFPNTEEPPALRFRSATRILGRKKETKKV